jgi:hypothetical protein
MTKTISKTTELLESMMTRMAAAIRYGVSLESIKLWQKLDGFPKDAIDRRYHPVLVDVAKIDAWLRSKLIHDLGPPPRWWGVVWGNLTPDQARRVQKVEQARAAQARAAT